MRTMWKALLPVAAAALSGCALNSYCEGEQDYAKATTMPPLQTVAGLELPESPSALRIPPPPANPVPFGEPYKDADGDDAVRCLDRPPEMPPVEPKPAQDGPAAPEAAPAATPESAPPAPDAEAAE